MKCHRGAEPDWILACVRGDERVGPTADMSFFVYILASRRNGTLYVGMTDDLSRRMWEHQTGAFPGFTKAYGVKTLVWVEVHQTRDAAFTGERQIKKWRRKWKLQLIEETNPDWHDLGAAGWLS